MVQTQLHHHHLQQSKIGQVPFIFLSLLGVQTKDMQYIHIQHCVLNTFALLPEINIFLHKICNNKQIGSKQ
jgi:hypothetical protein